MHQQYKSREACINLQLMTAVRKVQLTRNHHLHPCENMLRCWENINQVSESLEGHGKQKEKLVKISHLSHP